jgi:hypothetical protein
LILTSCQVILDNWFFIKKLIGEKNV